MNKSFFNYPISEEHKTKTKIGIAYTIGTDIKIPVSDGLDVLTGLQYIKDSYRFNDICVESISNKSIYKTNFYNHTIAVPLIISKNIAHSHFSIHTGIQIGYVVSSKVNSAISTYTKEQGSWTLSDTESEEIKTNGLVRKYRVSIPIGGQYEINRFVLSISYNHELVNILEGIHSQSLNIRLGYSL